MHRSKLLLLRASVEYCLFIELITAESNQEISLKMTSKTTLLDSIVEGKAKVFHQENRDTFF